MVVALILAFWLASPLFINVTVNEPLPSHSGKEQLALASGRFMNADSFHQTSGIATILQRADGQRFVRFTEFKATNGPDLFVLLATDKTDKSAVYLGPLKGNIGEQNYDIPSNIDVSRYRYILIWCRAFATLFGSAELLSTSS